MLRCRDGETTIKIEGINYTLDTNIESIARRAGFGQIDSHDCFRAVVVFQDDLGECSFTFRRR